MNRSLDRSRRRGKTLIEVMVVIAWASILFGIAGQLLHRLSRIERTGRDAAVVGRSEFRLLRDLRADVRAAIAVDLVGPKDGGSPGVRLRTAVGTIEYAAAAGGVRRTETADGETRYEAYRLGPADVRFATDGRLVTATVRPRTVPSNERRFAAGPLRIVAAIGLDAGRARPAGRGVTPVEAPRPEDAPSRKPERPEPIPVEAPRPEPTEETP